MKKSLRSAAILLLIVFAICLFPYASQAGQAGPDNDEKRDMSREMGMNPEVCAGLQRQINSVVDISQSALKNDEKIKKLADALTEAMTSMTKSAEKDPDMDLIVKQYTFFFKAILTSVLSSASSEKATPELKDEFEKLKILTSNYVNMAKMMCPDIKLPELMNK